ncbi:MAG: hypothetical protein RSG53_10290 [Oscillospiraceae bacterium]
MKSKNENCGGDTRMLHIFHTEEERRSCGGSAFMEIQFCKLPAETKIKDLVAVDSIKNWQSDSLYINEENAFYYGYSDILNCGIYNNLKSGVVDIYGINYYAPTFTDSIIKRLNEEKPVEYEILVEWLNKAKRYNGFYILGI